MLQAISTNVFAHHSTAHIDNQVEIEIKGTVVGYRYTNPHVHLMIAAADDAGESAIWSFEMQSPTILRRYGWDRNSWSEGDTITAIGHPAKNPQSRLVEGLRFYNADGDVFGTSVTKEMRPLPVIEEELIRLPAERMEGTWELGFVHGRVGPVPILYDRPTPEQLAAIPHFVHPSVVRFSLLLNEKGKQALATFDQQAKDNPWCAPDPFFLSHYIENVLLKIQLEEDRVVFQRPGMNFVVQIDGQHPPADELFTWGHAIGQWQGESLLIDVSNFEPNPWGLGRGLPSGPDKLVTHQIDWVEDRTMLFMDTTIFDPEYMIEPLQMKSRFVHSPHRELDDFVECSVDSATSFLDSL